MKVMRFDSFFKKDLLEGFGYEVLPGPDGIVVDKETKEPLVTDQNIDVTLSNFAGFFPGPGCRPMINTLPDAVRLANLLRA